MLSSLDEATKSICFPDKTQLNNLTFHEIFNLVSDHFSTPTPAHIEAVNAILAEPFLVYQNANSYDCHVAKHSDAHVALFNMLYPKRPLEKCNHFRHSLLNSEHAEDFKPFLTYYDADHVSLHHASFEDMNRACLPAISHIMAKVAAQSHLTQQFAVNAATTPLPARAPGIKRWCWTHGMMFHSSDRCKKPAAGHQKAATVSNKMGSTK